MSERIKRFLPALAYGAFYLTSFHWLEAHTKHYHIIYSSLDKYIPFCEFFVIPYLLWFLYIAVGGLFFIFFNDDSSEYWKLYLNLTFGMTLFLVISYLYPNGLMIRPNSFPRDNFCTNLVKMLYQADTSTNVLPSIHVYNSLAIFFAVNDCKKLRKHKAIRISAGILSILIVLSTMFLKQHSILDVVLGIVISYSVYLIIYRTRFKVPVKQHSVRTKKREKSL